MVEEGYWFMWRLLLLLKLGEDIFEDVLVTH